MTEPIDKPRTRSRQERHEATRPAQPTVAAYAAEVTARSQHWLASMARAQALFRQIDERFDDPAWRAAVIAEARSWREVLGEIPDDAPEAAREARARVLRWFDASADAGDAIILSLEAGDREWMIQAIAHLDEVTALALEAARSVARPTT
jgi:hypothetical protein